MKCKLTIIKGLSPCAAVCINVKPFMLIAFMSPPFYTNNAKISKFP